ncbi:uncharacterized protein TNIN_115891 [Trichonephila inaurata madagascariensis]|uniref:Uncharacterized protein n=1 Tax=Trichonephila inaurata madagascariensis TaxID=2747483 RepID=A0A8X6Y598_9ARAC|nr:uncharacterized protein TNIN_115891 [Trichonephila inaurata madagascariensis]
MASDLKLEIFASELFQAFWLKENFLLRSFETSFMYRNEYHLISQNGEAYKESYFKAVSLRCQLFRHVFQKEITENLSGFQFSAMYISDYISTTCERDDLFGNLTIFERLFFTCAFVVHLSIFCYKMQSYKEVIKYAHLCWAIYFEKYMPGFYRLGGWSQLMIVSVSYNLPYDLLSTCKALTVKDENSITFKVLEDVNSYKNFTLFMDIDYSTISKAWVRFHLQNLDRFEVCNGIENIKTVKDMKDSKKVEKVLTQLKRLCDPCGLESLKEIGNIKIPTTVTDQGDSKAPQPVKDTRNIFERENTLPQFVCTYEHPENNEESAYCLKNIQSPSLENSANYKSENELLVIPRELKIQQYRTVNSDESILEKMMNSNVQPETFPSFLEQNSSEDTNAGENFLETSGLDNTLHLTLNREHHETNVTKFRMSEGAVSKAGNLQTQDSVRQSIPHLCSDCKAQNNEICKQCAEIILQTQLKQADLNFNNMTADVSSDTKTKQTEIYVRENDNRTNAVTAKDLFRSTGFSTNGKKNDNVLNYKYLIRQKSSKDYFSENEAHNGSGYNVNKPTKKETDLERDSPEVKGLLKLILVLGNQQGIARVRSSLQELDERQLTNKFKRNYVMRGNVPNKSRCGRPQKLSDRDARAIVIKVKKIPKISVPKLADQIATASGKKVHPETVCRILR